MDDGADRYSFDRLRLDAGNVPGRGRALGRVVDRGLRSRHGGADDRARVQTAVASFSGRRDSPGGKWRAEALTRESLMSHLASPRNNENRGALYRRLSNLGGLHNQAA